MRMTVDILSGPLRGVIAVGLLSSIKNPQHRFRNVAQEATDSGLLEPFGPCHAVIGLAFGLSGSVATPLRPTNPTTTPCAQTAAWAGMADSQGDQ